MGSKYWAYIIAIVGAPVLWYALAVSEAWEFAGLNMFDADWPGVAAIGEWIGPMATGVIAIAGLRYQYKQSELTKELLLSQARHENMFMSRKEKAEMFRERFRSSCYDIHARWNEFFYRVAEAEYAKRPTPNPHEMRFAKPRLDQTGNPKDGVEPLEDWPIPTELINVDILIAPLAKYSHMLNGGFKALLFERKYQDSWVTGVLVLHEFLRGLQFELETEISSLLTSSEIETLGRDPEERFEVEGAKRLSDIFERERGQPGPTVIKG